MTSLGNTQYDEPKSGRHGGLKHLEQLFRLSDQNTLLSLDVIFISIDLEVSRDERALALKNEDHKPHIKELGIAWMDSRHIFPATSLSTTTPPLSQNKSAKTNFISTRQFSTSNASKDFEDCDLTDFRECTFAETFRITPQMIPTTIIRHLQFQDKLSTQSNTLRNIAIIGHSIKYDLRIIKQLGVNISCTAPIIALLDTYVLSRYVLGNQSRKFSLGAILDTLQCPYNPYELHNAGNDATYTLYALILLALRWAKSKELTPNESLHSVYLQVFIKTALENTPRWKPVRRALGAHWSKKYENAEQD